MGSTINDRWWAYIVGGIEALSKFMPLRSDSFSRRAIVVAAIECFEVKPANFCWPVVIVRLTNRSIAGDGHNSRGQDSTNNGTGNRTYTRNSGTHSSACCSASRNRSPPWKRHRLAAIRIDEVHRIIANVHIQIRLTPSK